MGVKLHAILAGEGAGSAKTDLQALIDGLAGGVAESDPLHSAMSRRHPRERQGQGKGAGAGKPHDADRTAARRRGARGDRVLAHARRAEPSNLRRMYHCWARPSTPLTVQ